MMEIHDPREIPVLTDAVDEARPRDGLFDAKAVHAAVVTETLKLADSLLHQAVKEIEATVFERVFDQLRARLPELLDRVLRENAPADGAAARAREPAAVRVSPIEPDARP